MEIDYRRLRFQLAAHQIIAYIMEFVVSKSLLPVEGKFFLFVLMALLSACTSVPQVSAPPPPIVVIEPPIVEQIPVDRESDSVQPLIQTPEYEQRTQVETEAAFDEGPLRSVEAQLLADAANHLRQGSLQLASASVERVLRINPHSATALVELAKLRLAQDAPKEAEQLLLKAISAGSYDHRAKSKIFKREAWMLIVEVREAMGDLPGVQAALAKLEKLK